MMLPFSQSKESRGIPWDKPRNSKARLCSAWKPGWCLLEFQPFRCHGLTHRSGTKMLVIPMDRSLFPRLFEVTSPPSITREQKPNP